MKFLHCAIPCLCFIFFSGCGVVAYYSTESDPQFSLNKQEPIAIYTGEMPTVSEKKLGRLLGELMALEGFKVAGFNIDSQKTACRVTFKTNTSSQTYTGSYTTYKTSTHSTYIPGNFSPYGYKPSRTITTTTQTPISNVYTSVVVYRTMGINIFCENNGKLDNIWYGSFSADMDTYDIYREYILVNLIRLIGTDFEGYLDVSSIDE